MKRRIAAAAVGISALVLSLAGCGEDMSKSGNVGDVELKGGDVYAVISVMDYGSITCKLFPDIAPVAVEKFTELAERGYYDGKDFHRIVDDFIIQGGSFNGDGTDGEISETDYFPIETSEYARHFYGALCFAAGNNGNYAQFYIVNNDERQDIEPVIAKLTEQLADTEITSRLTAEQLKYYRDYLASLQAIPENVRMKYSEIGGEYSLDGKATVFGQMIDGAEVLEAISKVEVVSGNKIDDVNGVSSKPLNVVVIENVEIIRIETEESTSEGKSKPKTTTTTGTTPDVVHAVTVDSQALTTTTVPETEDTASETTTSDPDATYDSSYEFMPESETTTAASREETPVQLFGTDPEEPEEPDVPESDDDEIVEIDEDSDESDEDSDEMFNDN